MIPYVRELPPSSLSYFPLHFPLQLVYKYLTIQVFLPSGGCGHAGSHSHLKIAFMIIAVLLVITLKAKTLANDNLNIINVLSFGTTRLFGIPLATSQACSALFIELCLVVEW